MTKIKETTGKTLSTHLRERCQLEHGVFLHEATARIDGHALSLRTQDVDAPGNVARPGSRAVFVRNAADLEGKVAESVVYCYSCRFRLSKHREENENENS